VAIVKITVAREFRVLLVLLCPVVGFLGFIGCTAVEKSL
jgi:hypothetical protein